MISSLHLRAGSLMAVFFAVASPALVHAEDAGATVSTGSRSQALRELRDGNRAFESGDYEGALAAYHRAYANVPSPKVQFNLGQAYRYLGRLRDAREAYRRFLSEARDAAPALRAEAVQHLADVERALAVEQSGATITAPVPTPPAPSAGPSPMAPTDVATVTAPATPAASTRSTTRLGLILRVDVDRALEGAAGAGALTIALAQWFDAAAGGFWWPAGGRNIYGVSLGGVAFLLPGTWRPLVAADAQVYFVDGPHPAARAAVGLQWQPTTALGVFATGTLEQVSTDHFKESPSFVPAVGLQLRL